MKYFLSFQSFSTIRGYMSVSGFLLFFNSNIFVQKKKIVCGRAFDACVNICACMHYVNIGKPLEGLAIFNQYRVHFYSKMILIFILFTLPQY